MGVDGFWVFDECWWVVGGARSGVWFWVFLFIFLIGGIWIWIQGLVSKSGVMKVLEFFVLDKVWLQPGLQPWLQTHHSYNDTCPCT
jgi:hypothetical protein